MMNEEFIKIVPLENCAEYNSREVHRHERYEIIWFTEVEENATIQIDFVEYPIYNNCFYFVSSGQLHCLDRKGKKGYVLILSKSFYYAVSPIELRSRSLFAINSILNQRKCTMCRTMIDLILREYKEEKRYLLLETYFKALLIHLIPIFTKHMTHDPDFKRISDLMDLIEVNYTVHKEVGFYATQLSLTEKGLNDLSKKVTGKTVKLHLQERLLLEMKRQICCGQNTMKEISYQLGFNEPSYFCRFFKAKTNRTPEEFKMNFLI